MSNTQILLLCVCGVFLLVIAVLAAIGNLYSLKGIPNKRVGNGQHGTARFATTGEINRTYKQIHYLPIYWRFGKDRPTVDGLIVGCQETAGGMNDLVDN